MKNIIFAEKVEKAWLEYDKGLFESKSKEDFLKELESCCMLTTVKHKNNDQDLDTEK